MCLKNLDFKRVVNRQNENWISSQWQGYKKIMKDDAYWKSSW